MKKISIISRILSVVCCIMMATSVCNAQNLTGSGTESDPYQISSQTDLETFAKDVNSGISYVGQFIKLTDNIVCYYNENQQWTPIGNYNNKFQGIFDGNGKTISGLYFNDENQDFVGLFGCNQGTIQNVGVVDSYFKGHQYIGGVCGANESVNTNCYNTANVSGYQFVGGVSGVNYGGTITNCYNTGIVGGDWNFGGVYGDNEEGTITNCYDFKVNGGTLGEYSIVVDNNKITLPTKGKMLLEGYTFGGWYDNKGFNNNVIESEDANFDVHTLYAKWIGNSVPTAIKAVETENNDKTIKTIKDGQIVIIRNGVMYDMQGKNCNFAVLHNTQ